MDPTDHEINGIQIYHKLGSMEAKLDAVMERVSDYNKDMGEAFSRLRNLETKFSWVLGAAAVISILVPVIVGAISDNFMMRIEPHQTNRHN